jgi:Fic family protein
MQTFRDLDDHLGMVPARSAAALAQASAGRGREEAFRRQNPQVLASLMEVALIQSSASSNAIEQITAAPGRVTELVQDKTTPESRSEEEIAGYRKVLDTIHSSAEHIPLKTSAVLQFHRDIYAFSPTPGGHFKSTQNEVARFDQQGKKLAVIFEGVSPFETPAAMDELHERFADAIESGSHAPLFLAGAYVFDFLMIHPFNEGNGRMSRLLTLLILYHWAMRWASSSASRSWWRKARRPTTKAWRVDRRLGPRRTRHLALAQLLPRHHQRCLHRIRG